MFANSQARCGAERFAGDFLLVLLTGVSRIEIIRPDARIRIEGRDNCSMGKYEGEPEPHSTEIRDLAPWQNLDYEAVEIFRRNRFRILVIFGSFAFFLSVIFSIQYPSPFRVFFAQLILSMFLWISCIGVLFSITRFIFVSHDAIVREPIACWIIRLVLLVPILPALMAFAVAIDMIHKYPFPTGLVSVCMAAIVLVYMIQAGMLFLAFRIGRRVPYSRVRFWTDKRDIVCMIGTKNWEFDCVDKNLEGCAIAPTVFFVSGV
ncbi:hypothetical protein LLG95_06740 [bacterium]|nr:hypothetical protein [bacterium]